jgi:protein-disulfide isomerase
MLKLSRLIFTLALLWVAVMVSHAQDENPYAGIPMSRGEDGAFIIGDPSADVKIVEFSDFLCPHCQTYNEQIIKPFIEEYVATGQAQFEYRMVLVIDQNLSAVAANLVECADMQSEGLFWHAHDVMFSIVEENGLTENSIGDFIEQLDLDATELINCAQTVSQFQTDAQYASELGITGTPSIAVIYGDADPLMIVADVPGFDIILNANRPITNEVVTIESGRYEGISTYRTDDGGLVLGEPDAPLHIVAFEDYMCPQCQTYKDTIQPFITDYVATGQAQFEYRFYPLVSPEFSFYTAHVADCIALQDLSVFWEAHDMLFDLAASDEIDENLVATIGEQIDIDVDAVNDCLDTTIQPLVDVQLGQISGITGTPGIRAIDSNGQLEVIYVEQQPLSSGAVPLEVLVGLAEGAEGISIGEPEIKLLNDADLTTDSLITNEPCSAPCWENITPGETTMADASAILAEMESIIVLQEDQNTIVFTADENTICCQVISENGTGEPDDVVGIILLQLAPTNTLGQYIEVHGEPTYVSGDTHSDTEAILTLFYPAAQTIINVVVEGPDGQLTEDTPIFAALYTSQTIIETIIASAPMDNWKGLLTFNDYMDGEFDVNSGD